VESSSKEGVLWRGVLLADDFLEILAEVGRDVVGEDSVNEKVGGTEAAEAMDGSSV
jgi:hypothetical protein